MEKLKEAGFIPLSPAQEKRSKVHDCYYYQNGTLVKSRKPVDVAEIFSVKGKPIPLMCTYRCAWYVRGTDLNGKDHIVTWEEIEPKYITYQKKMKYLKWVISHFQMNVNIK